LENEAIAPFNLPSFGIFNDNIGTILHRPIKTKHSPTCIQFANHHGPTTPTTMGPAILLAPPPSTITPAVGYPFSSSSFVPSSNTDKLESTDTAATLATASSSSSFSCYSEEQHCPAKVNKKLPPPPPSITKDDDNSNRITLVSVAEKNRVAAALAASLQQQQLVVTMHPCCLKEIYTTIKEHL
jgi:hypothetical protein